MLTKKQLKKDAKALKEGLGISLSAAYQMIAVQNGFKNWNVMAAALRDVDEEYDGLKLKHKQRKTLK